MTKLTAKKRYEIPRLELFGSVRNLTGGTVGGDVDTLIPCCAAGGISVPPDI